MQSIDTLIVGAGISGLATAAALDRDYLILEADSAIGGYCKTTLRDGFVWDYSGHFFHFRHPEIGAWFRERMAGQRIFDIQKRSFIAGPNYRIDFPFQKNIHQLPQADFIRCLHDLYFARQEQPAQAPSTNFKAMLQQRYGAGISELFLIPYNEKLYACDLSSLDPNAMGRFFPHVELAEVIRNMRTPDNRSYNSTFTYPAGGAIEYVKALANEVRPTAIHLRRPLRALDLAQHVAHTDQGPIRYRHLVSSIPFNRLLQLAHVPHDPQIFSWNKVVVFNLGFDRKADRNVHWVYFPDPTTVFYRVGYYDNILNSDRLSLYVEVGFDRAAQPDTAALQAQVLADLKRNRVISDHQLVASQCLTMDPAYVHITEASIAAHARHSQTLAKHNVYSIGRYGSWTYCSIEDNVVQARQTADHLNRFTS